MFYISICMHAHLLFHNGIWDTDACLLVHSMTVTNPIRDLLTRCFAAWYLCVVNMSCLRIVVHFPEQFMTVRAFGIISQKNVAHGDFES
jgi:hypothetical protein